jgi:hypothetical protein
MGMNGARRRARSWQCGAWQAATIIAVAAGCSAPSANEAPPVPAARADAAQSTSEDPCRYFTDQEMGKAFGRPMKSSRRANVCQYLGGTDSGLVVVKVETGPEGTIIRHAKSASAQGHKGVEKVATAAGEAYFESILPVFIGRVGNHEVQIETTIEPVPREAMIAVGLRIMETVARK